MLATRANADNTGVVTITIPALEASEQSLSARLNWLRAGVLGANDGIVSTAGLVFGVAGATADSLALLIAGLAGLVAGALSMAGGEYVSVSSQKDTETAALAAQSQRLSDDPEGELQRLADHYAGSGLSSGLARQVAEELTSHAALDAHARVFLHLDANERVVAVTGRTLTREQLVTLVGRAFEHDLDLDDDGQLRGLVVTLAEAGCEVWRDGNCEGVPAVAPAAVVDPTGCGDAWRGALLHGLEQGWDLVRCARLGNYLGALKVAHRGPQNYQVDATAVAAY